MKIPTKISVFKKVDLFLLGTILIMALTLRLYKINTPLADLHSWRQTDTAAVARNFVRNGFNLLSPRFDDLSDAQSGKNNPQGLRFVEFPLYNSIFAFFYKYAPYVSLEIYGRIISIFFSLIIVCVLYYLALKEVGRAAAFISAVTYAVFPFFVFFSRVVLPDTMATALSISSIFFLYLYTEQKTTSKKILLFVSSLISFSLALLVKPMAIFFIFTLIYLFIKKYRLSLWKCWFFYIYFIIAIVPLALWRNYIAAFPEGIPYTPALFTGINTSEGLKNIFFRPAFFRWIFFERINNLILGGYLFFFFILGIVRKPKSYLLYSIMLSSLVYLFVFQGGNVQHEYYQVLILPAIALFVGAGVDFILKNQKVFISSLILYPLIFVFFAFSFYISYYRIRDFYNYPHDLTYIAKIVSTLTSPKDKIITDTTGDTTLLYLSDRKGSPTVSKDLQEMKKEGYSFFYTARYDIIEQLKLERKFELVFENDKFALFKL